MANTLLTFTYLAASILFILAIRGLASPETARKGNLLGIGGMLALCFRLFVNHYCHYRRRCHWHLLCPESQNDFPAANDCRI